MGQSHSRGQRRQNKCWRAEKHVLMFIMHVFGLPLDGVCVCVFDDESIPFSSAASSRVGGLNSPEMPRCL